ncbi:MAG: hypothetical protein GY850_25940, partial [bacterium]|nr:hypothetical protein [bacterium]
MGSITMIRFSVLAVAMAVLVFSPGARADTPMCDDVVNNPTIVTCTCICEASSSFPGCQGLDENTAAPTPNRCNDMLHGRRVILRQDWPIIENPFPESGGTNVNRKAYKTNPGSAPLVSDTPYSTPQFDVACTTDGAQIANTPFPQRTRMARLFNTPNDWMVTVAPRPSPELEPDCWNDIDPNTGNTPPNFFFYLKDVKEGTDITTEFTNQHNVRWVQLAVDDFDYDGYDDFFFLNINLTRTYSAKDPDDPSQGLAPFGLTKFAAGTQSPLNEPSTGDFNGDEIVKWGQGL